MRCAQRLLRAGVKARDVVAELAREPLQPDEQGPVPCHTTAARRSSSRRTPVLAALPRTTATARQLVEAPGGVVTWELAAVRRGQYLGEWIVVTAATLARDGGASTPPRP